MFLALRIYRPEGIKIIIIMIIIVIIAIIIFPKSLGILDTEGKKIFKTTTIIIIIIIIIM